MQSTVRYALAFYADVARRAAVDVDGVVGTARDPFLGVIGRISKGYNRGGVRVYNRPEGLCLEVDIVAAFGRDLREVLKEVQRSIVERITSMTGSSPARVTVAVKGVAGKEQP